MKGLTAREYHILLFEANVLTDEFGCPIEWNDDEDPDYTPLVPTRADRRDPVSGWRLGS